MKIYTDGACSGNRVGGNQSSGGWAFAIINDFDEIVLADSNTASDTTNNEMELTAIVRAISNFVSMGYDDSYEIYTDSAYIVNAFEQEWYKKWQSNGWITSKKTPVAHIELWKKIIPYYESGIITLHKVAGHSGDRFNEYVDRLAQRASKRSIK
jgi:ribonuclease HI